MTEQREISCVYKATTKKGETAHFGEYSAAKAWAGWGSVERIQLTTLTLIEKPKKTCGTCEALARTVMLDQTSHDRHQRDEQKHFKLGYDAGVLETQLDQAKDRNFCPRCGKRLMSALGPVSLHTCCPPQGRTFDDYGNKLS